MIRNKFIREILYFYFQLVNDYYFHFFPTPRYIIKMNDVEEIEKSVLQKIDELKDELIKFHQEIVKIPSENPTSKGKELAQFLNDKLNAFGIKWIGSKTFAFFFKLPKEQAEKVNIKMTKYETGWKEAVYYIEPGKTKTNDFIPLFEQAYKRLTGE